MIWRDSIRTFPLTFPVIALRYISCRIVKTVVNFVQALASLRAFIVIRNLSLEKSGIGLPHSTTLARNPACLFLREVVECGSPMPLSRRNCGIDHPVPLQPVAPSCTQLHQIISLSQPNTLSR